METSHNIKLVAFGDLNTPTYYQLITIGFFADLGHFTGWARPPQSAGGAAELHLKWGF